MGSWPTKLTPELIAGGSLRLSFPSITPAGALSWQESRPSEGGRSVVVQHRAHGEPQELTPPGLGVGSRVHEYGGLAHVLTSEGCLFVDKKSQRLHLMHGADLRTVTRQDAWPCDLRLAHPIFDARRRRVIAVGESHDGARVENGLVSIDLASGTITWLARGHDFFDAPALSPDGEQLAWLCWDAPHMSWDAGRIELARVAPDGSLERASTVAGGPDGSAMCPTWSSAGELTFVLEGSSGFWNLHRLRGAEVVCVLSEEEEWGAPQWNSGTTLFAFSDARTIVGAPLRHGVACLRRVDLRTGLAETLIEDVGHVGHVAARGDDVLLSQGWAGQGSRLLHVNLRTREVTVLRDALAPLFAKQVLTDADLPKAEPVSFATSRGEQAHAFFYAPTSERYQGAPDELPPLLVLAHGGPTGVTSPLPSATLLSFTTRGFAVLDVNYRGSVGFGRRYRERLRGEWGALDVDDCVAGALAMAERGRVDRRRLAIRGGSAGGLTVLLALTRRPRVFAVGTCLYAVSDPRKLSDATHKFEAHYEHFLFGEGEARERALAQRSPLALVDQIETPVILFQGLLDKAVTPDQSQCMFEALRARGVPCELHTYPDEGHGFRAAATLRDVAEKEAAFYARHFTASRPR